MFLPAPHLIVQPDDGSAPVLDFIRLARKSLFIKQFTFTQPELMEAVVERKNAGVAVRVMLNPKRSSGDRANDATFEFFKSAGVAIKWANPECYVTHEKSIVVDGHAALIATFNLWSNINSRAAMSRFMDSARHSLDIQHPKFLDTTILDRILAAADRGVRVRVLCGGKHGISDCDILDTFSSLRMLHRSGIKVHKQKNLRLHAKLLLADQAHALVGSMNIDRSAFDLRRELGTQVSDPGVVARLFAVFEKDWDSSHRYEAPDPLDASVPHEPDFPHDPTFIHE